VCARTSVSWTPCRPATRSDSTCRNGGRASRACSVHGSLTTGEESWEAQRPLAAEGFRLVVPDRRGYGASPDVAGEDYLRDGEDVAELLGDAAHLVGHSYGGLAALVAAARRPEAVLSLTLIEPPAFGLCAGHRAVDALVAELQNLWARTRLTDRQFLEAFLRLVGESPEALPEEMLDAWTPRVPVLRHGRPPWEAEVPLDRIASSSARALVVSGDHHAAFNAVCAELGRRLDARTIAVRGAGHEVQMMAEPCNRALLELWRSV
jgi:pimeloyl-ACP methyl ester carboxylesterase